LPWRVTYSPYNIWIAEIMSQQSTLAMMLPFYKRWMQHFKNVQAVAAASDSELLKFWEGLGYYSRVRNIHKSAQLLALSKKWPEEYEQWLKLPGVGPYTAAAVVAQAFHKKKIAIDGNVLRVFARFYRILDPLNKKQDRLKIESKVRKLESESKVDFRLLSQAFMELGALVCRPGALLNCSLCPLQKSCKSFSKKAELIPRKKQRTYIKKNLLLTIYRNKKSQVLLRQIPEGSRLAGQWELPVLELGEGRSFQDFADSFVLSKEVSHSITKYKYRAVGAEAGLWRGKLPGAHKYLSEGFEGTVTTLSKKVLSAF